MIPPQERELTYLVEFYVRVSNLAGPPEELGFATVVFDLLLDNGVLQNPVFPRWQNADGPRAYVDLDGPGGQPPQPKWNCSDCPTHQLDLQQLVVGSFPQGFGDMGVDPRWTNGQGPFPNDEPGEYLGFLLVNWDGANLGSLDVIVTDFTLFDDELDVFTAEGTMFGGQVLFGVPEPATAPLAVAAISLVAMCGNWRRRLRRQSAEKIPRCSTTIIEISSND